MALAIAQSTKGAKTVSTGTSQTVSFVSNTTTGNGVFVSTCYDSGVTAAVTGVTCGGVAMTLIGSQVEGGGAIGNVSLWYLPNITGATTPAVVATLAGAYIGGMIIAEVSGLATSSVLDGSAVLAKDAAAGATISASYTNTNANDIIFAAMGTGDGGQTYTGTNSTIILQQQKIGTTDDMALGYKIVAATGANTLSATTTNVDDWAIIVQGFKDNSGGTAPVYKSRSMMMGV